MAKIPYRKIPRKIIAGAALVAMLGAGAASLTVDTVADFEGYVPEGYLDPVGIPTKCFGDTTDVVFGEQYTFEECSQSLNTHLARNTSPIMRCVPDLATAPDKVKAAAASMAYNIGPTAFCKSTVAQYFRKEQWERGCRRMAQIYQKAGGKVWPGLERRRKFESQMCLQGLREGR